LARVPGLVTAGTLLVHLALLLLDGDGAVGLLPGEEPQDEQDAGDEVGRHRFHLPLRYVALPDGPGHRHAGEPGEQRLVVAQPATVKSPATPGSSMRP
jgi:hypothetical protein